MRYDFDKAKAYCFKLFKFRLRTEKEIRDKLKRRQFCKDVIEDVIEYFKSLNYINDSAFTKSWIESRIQKPFGLKRITYELREKGISERIIEEEIFKLKNFYSEYDIAKGIAEERFRKIIQRIDPEKAKRRIYSFLLRRGFSSDIALDIINKFLR